MTAARQTTAAAEASTARSRSTPFRADIQGLRAIAVLLVVAYHVGAVGVSGGYVGVDVFFVISGFLITSHLMVQLERNDRISFGEFYARRARRILPASFTVLIATLISIAFLTPPVLRHREFWDGIWTTLYVPNMAFAIQGTEYLAEKAPSAFQHYWSLGVEEQFYVLWPAILLIVWVCLRSSRKAFARSILTVVVLSFVYCVWLTQNSQPWAFFGLPARAWELGIGGLIAIGGAKIAGKFSPRMRSAGGWIGLAGILAAGFLFSPDVTFPGVAALLPVAGAALVVFFGQIPSKYSPARCLGLRPLVFIGSISYSMYLVHWPILTLASQVNGGDLAPFVAILLGLASIPLAWLLYKYIENPMRKGNRWGLRSSRRTLYFFAGATAITLAIAIAGIWAIRSVAIDSGQTAPTTENPAKYPKFTKFVPENMKPTLEDASKDIPSIYGDGCHLDVPQTKPPECTFGDLSSPTSIALFGDSHAAQWFPALKAIAESQRFRLETFTKSSCPSVDVPIYIKNVEYTQCKTWRDNVISHLAENPPDIIILSNMQDQPDQPVSVNPSRWREGESSVIKRLPTSSTVVVLSDTPRMPQTPSICLSQHVADALKCSIPRSEAISTIWTDATKVGATSAGAEFISMNDYICGRTECGAIIGNNLVYRDSSHLTATFAAQLSDSLLELLEQKKLIPVSGKP